MSHFIKEEWGPTGIRKRICDYLEKNLPIIEGMETRDILALEAPTSEDYIKKMRHTSTWGGAVEIQCACNIWNARIIVHDIRGHHRHRDHRKNKIEFLPLNSSTNLPLIEFHLEWSGGHYEPRKQ